MSLFSVNGYQHTFDGIRHVWERPGYATLSVRASGADLVPRGATAERTRRRRFLPYQLRGWGNNTNGNDQGGQGIELKPAWRSDTLAALDGTIERHPVCAFTASGDLLTRAQLGYGFEYTPANDRPQVQRIPALAGNLPSSGDALTWERIDPAHLIRAFGPAVAAWKERRDPIAFWWLQVVANDVMLSYADQKIVGGTYATWSLAQMAENAATTYSASTPGGRKGTAAFGELRAHAWSLRAVVEAMRALDDAMDSNLYDDGGLSARYDAWISTFIRLVHDVQAENGALTCNDYLQGQDQSQPWFTDQLAGTPDRTAPYLLRFDELEIATFQVPFMLRALYEAQALLQDADCTAMVREVVRKWMRVYRTCPLVPSEYGSGAYGLPHYIVVQNGDGLVPALVSGIGRATDGQYAPDARTVARLLGVRT